MSTEIAEKRLTIDLWADVVCPSCYIGDNRLQKAIAESGLADKIDIVLHSFELHPETPDEILNNSEVLATMLGVSLAEADANEARLAPVARADGLPFEIDRGHRNTRSILRVLQLAGEYGVAVELMNVVQHAAFGGDYEAFSHEFLIEEASKLGIPDEETRDVLSSDRYGAEVDADRAQALRMGARGVPFAVLGERYAIPGAASIDGYRQAIAEAWKAVNA